MKQIEDRKQNGQGEGLPRGALPVHLIPDAISAPRWIVLRTNGHQERLAASSLTAAGIQSYLPILLKDGKREAVIGPMFPGFVFTRLAIGAPGWTSIFRARGVKSLMLSPGGKPAALLDKDVERMKSAERAGYIHLLPAVVQPEKVYPFKAGDRVKINVGHRVDIDAVFHERVDSKRCEVLIRILGDSQRIAQVELASLAKAGADAIDLAST